MLTVLADRSTARQSDALSDVPTELMDHILLPLSLHDRISFGATCTRNRALASRASRLACAESVRPYGLTFSDVTFLQEAVGALVSGSTITQLVQSDPSFVPGDLDIYCPIQCGYDVVLFLKLCSQYSVDRRSHEYDTAQGLRYVWWLTHPDTNRPSINVIESLSDNALDAVLHFHSTPVMGAWVAAGLWHAYPKPTMRHLALSSQQRLPLTGEKAARSQAEKVVRKYMARGYKFVSEWIHPHTCGVDWSCPITLRTSTDPGCLWYALDGHLNPKESERSALLASSWTLGNVPCPTAMMLTFGKRVGHYRFAERT